MLYFLTKTKGLTKELEINSIYESTVTPTVTPTVMPTVTPTVTPLLNQVSNVKLDKEQEKFLNIHPNTNKYFTKECLPFSKNLSMPIPKNSFNMDDCSLNSNDKKSCIIQPNAHNLFPTRQVEHEVSIPNMNNHPAIRDNFNNISQDLLEEGLDNNNSVNGEYTKYFSNFYSEPISPNAPPIKPNIDENVCRNCLVGYCLNGICGSKAINHMMQHYYLENPSQVSSNNDSRSNRLLQKIAREQSCCD